MPAIDIQSVESRLSAPQAGDVLFHRDHRRLSELHIQEHVEGHRSSGDEPARVYGWLDSSGRTAIASAQGEDERHHWANSYLVGILPFTTENKWLPLYALDQRMTHQTDLGRYG